MATPARSLPHVRPVQPLHFPVSEPEDEHLGQSTRHLELCMALYRLLREAVAAEHTVGADQFVYFNAANPRRCLAPDAFVTLGRPQSHFESYKVWEEGVPHVAFEVLSPSDTPEKWTLREKLRRYAQLGVRELIVFHVDGRPGQRLRAWDRIDDDLVERVVEGERSPCLTLGLEVLVAPLLDHPIALRLRHGPALVTLAEEREAEAKTREAEAKTREAEAKTREAEATFRAAEETKRRAAAEARAAELEAELARLRGG